MRRSLTLLIILFAFVLAQKPKHEIKFAALAPKGSTWMNLLEELDVALREASDGELGFTIYAGGVAGDELKVLRKNAHWAVACGGFNRRWPGANST
jgi:TRAP-type C4-dicarboxylate transport system substrate-binding protein